MSLPIPQSTPPTCTLWVDGVRMADGATAGELPTDPVVLTDLKVVWGRENTLDQPEPGTCTFDVLDQGGGVKFTDQLHIGSKIDVRAAATIYPDPTVPIFAFDPGFEGMAVGSTPPSLALGATAKVVSSPVHAGTRALRIEPSGRRNPALVIFPPAPFSADPTAWDLVPQALAGQSWTYGASVRAVSLLGGAQVVRVRPVAFTGTDGSAGTYQVLTDALSVPSDGAWYSVSGTGVPPAGVWMGVAVEIAAPGPSWDTVPVDVTWDSLGGAATRDNLQPDPRFTSTAAKTKSAGTSANATGSLLTGLTGHPAGLTTAYRTTVAADYASTANWYVGAGPVVNAPTVGDYYRAGAWVRRSVAGNMYLRIVNVNGSSVNGPNLPVAANTWTWLTAGGAVAPGTTSMSVIAMPGSALPLTAGQTLDMTGLRAERVADAAAAAVAMTPAEYFDGATPDAGGIDYAWTGAANNSTSTATDTRPAVRWDDLGAVFVDDLVLTAPDAGAVLGGIVFSGRLTDMTSQYDLAAGATVVRCIAQTHLAEMDNRYVGDEPWLLETLAARFGRIVTLSGQQLAYKIDTSVQAVPVTWRDVDSQPAGALLHQLAQSVGGALWSAFSDSTGVYAWLEDINNRPSLWILVKDPDAVIRIHQNTDPSATAVFMNLDACDIDLEPVTWTQSSEDDATRTVITWQDQTLDDKGNPKPTSRDEITIDTGAEQRTGRRRIQITTQLAQQTDAAAVGQAVLARAQAPGWRIGGLEWNLTAGDRLDADQLQRLMRILDGVTRLGLGLLLTGVPTWAPPATGEDIPLFLEGGTFINHEGAWELELITSSAEAQGKSSLRWNDLPGSPMSTRTNPVPNPQDRTGGAGTWTAARSFGTGGAGTYTHSQSVVGPVSNPADWTACRKTWTTAATANTSSGFNVRMNATTHFPVTPGQVLTVSCWVRFAGTGTRTFQFILQFFTGTTVGGEGTLVSQPTAAAQSVAANTWTRLAITVTVPATANSMALYPDVVAGGTLWAVGNTADCTGMLIEPAIVTRTNRVPNPQDRTGGSAGWLTTRTFGTGGAGTHTHSQAVAAPGVAPSILTACRKTWTTASTTPDQTGLNVGATATDWFPVTAGEQITVSVFMRHNSTTAKDFAVWVAFYDRTVMATAVPVGSSVGSSSVSVAGTAWLRVSYTVTVPAGAAGMRVIPDVRSGAGPWAVGEWLDVSGLMIEAGPVATTYLDGDAADTATSSNDWTGAAWQSSSIASTIGDYFDGSSTDTLTRDYAWAGSAWASASTEKDISGWVWDQFDPAISWNDLQGVGI